MHLFAQTNRAKYAARKERPCIDEPRLFQTYYGIIGEFDLCTYVQPEMTAAWNDHVCSLPISQISGLRNRSKHEQNATFVNTLHAAECLDRCIFSVPIAAEALIADAHGRQCEDVCRQYYSKHIME